MGLMLMNWTKARGGPRATRISCVHLAIGFESRGYCESCCERINLLYQSNISIHIITSSWSRPYAWYRIPLNHSFISLTQSRPALNLI